MQGESQRRAGVQSSNRAASRSERLKRRLHEAASAGRGGVHRIRLFGCVPLREFALWISLTSLGSSHTFLLPHLSTEAARRFCNFRDTIVQTVLHAQRTQQQRRSADGQQPPTCHDPALASQSMQPSPQQQAASNRGGIAAASASAAKEQRQRQEHCRALVAAPSHISSGMVSASSSA